MSVQLDRLIAEVAETKSVVGSYIALSNALIAELRAAKDDPAKIQELADELDLLQGDVANAIAANTAASAELPSAPPVEEEEVPAPVSDPVISGEEPATPPSE